MRLLHYIEIENFKTFGERQRIALDHPSVLIGPNNSGKTTVLQAIALWSQAVKVWIDGRRDSTARERLGVPLNRLSLVAVPVSRTSQLLHDGRQSSTDGLVYVCITAGVEWSGQVRPVKMRFRQLADEVLYCSPEPDTAGAIDLELMEHAASIGVHLLYPMSGLESEETVLRPGRVEALIGRGQTAQVLRNLCLSVYEGDPDRRRWHRIVERMQRLFSITLSPPTVSSAETIEITYRDDRSGESFDLGMVGRGCLQMLLLMTYLASHEGCALLIDEPDAHFEILRQRQVFIILRDIAAETGSQVVIVTHSEVLLDEALETNLTLLVDGRAEEQPHKGKVQQALKHFGTAHYARAKIARHILYVEGSTDLDMLRALAQLLEHPAVSMFDGRLNTYYVENNYPDDSVDAKLERVEGGFGIQPIKHFFGLRSVVEGLRGLAILDNDGKARHDRADDVFKQVYWRRYEIENYFITPELLSRYAHSKLAAPEEAQQGLFASDHARAIDATLDALILERVFAANVRNFETYRTTDARARELIWLASTQTVKLSVVAEQFFEKLAHATHTPMLLTKGSLHHLVRTLDPAALDPEVGEKLDLMHWLRQG